MTCCPAARAARYLRRLNIGPRFTTKRGYAGSLEFHEGDNHPGSSEIWVDVADDLYLPNGNPQPGPKSEYKMQWLARLHAYAAELLASKQPVALVGDYNVIPTDCDVYKPESWRDDALMHPDAQKAFQALVAQGWTDAIRKLHPKERVYTFWDYWRNAWARDAGLRIDHFLLSPVLAKRLTAAKVDCDARGREGASDHAPVWIELADKPANARTFARAKKAGVKPSPIKKAAGRKPAAKRKPASR